MRPSGIGGMAVIEGVMMKNKNEYAIAVRKPNNEITVEKKSHRDFSDKVKLFKLPIFRGILAFIDSMVIGMKVLNFSASFFEEEEGDEKKEVSEKTNAFFMVLAVFLSLVLSVSLFMVLPVLLSHLFSKWVDNLFLLSLMEGVLRLIIFIGYILLASQMKDIKRVFMYHGAEHKTINCLENGFELTLENVKWQSKAHKRCGTSFMLLVMLISLVFFMVLRPETLALRILSRVLLVPAIAGISYEFIRLAGRSESKLVDILSRPGLWMQALTTKEPEDDMIEVAIVSVDTIFDWKGFLEKAEEKHQVSTSELKENSQEKKIAKTKDVSKAKKALEDKNLHEDKSVSETKSAKKTESIKKIESSKKSVNGPDKTTSKEKIAKKESHHKKNEAKEEYAVAGEISIASPKREYEEDDEILKALDKYLDFKEDK
jgi:uncharacterized protein YqhQ